MESIVKAISFMYTGKNDVRYDIMGSDCPNDYWCSCNGARTCPVA